MGQAKKRGTFEERRYAAVMRLEAEARAEAVRQAERERLWEEKQRQRAQEREAREAAMSAESRRVVSQGRHARHMQTAGLLGVAAAAVMGLALPFDGSRDQKEL